MPRDLIISSVQEKQHVDVTKLPKRLRNSAIKKYSVSICPRGNGGGSRLQSGPSARNASDISYLSSFFSFIPLSRTMQSLSTQPESATLAAPGTPSVPATFLQDADFNCIPFEKGGNTVRYRSVQYGTGGDCGRFKSPG